MDLVNLNIKKTQENLRNKIFSTEELVKAFFDRIRKFDHKINSFVTLNIDDSLKKAKKTDENIASGKSLLSLEGIPIAVKDNFCTKDLRTTVSSKVLDNFIPVYDATVVRKLKDAGAIIVGKTNMDAWAHGSSTETSDYGSSHNPWNLKHSPGGSSGGSGAAVASSFCLSAIGSETAGSIRQPASWCGIVGFKPTYGRVSRYGVIAMGSSLDCPGPMTNNVEDAALILNAIAGQDNFDATTSPRKFSDFSEKQNKKITIGIPKEYFGEGIDNEVKEKVMESVKLLEKIGHKIVEIALFSPSYAISVYTILQRSEVSSNLGRYDGIRYGFDRNKFGDEAKRRIMLGTYTLSAGYYDAYYLKAQKVRTLIVNNFEEAFKKVDVILGPTCPVTALPIGASEESPMFGETQDMLVEPSSIAGLPGINLTCGFSKNKLPIGMQIIAPQFKEQRIFDIAYQYEKETEWQKQKPVL